MRPRFLLRRFHSLYTLHGTSDDMNEDCAVRIYVLYVVAQLLSTYQIVVGSKTFYRIFASIGSLQYKRIPLCTYNYYDTLRRANQTLWNNRIYCYIISSCSVLDLKTAAAAKHAAGTCHVTTVRGAAVQRRLPQTPAPRFQHCFLSAFAPSGFGFGSFAIEKNG